MLSTNDHALRWLWLLPIALLAVRLSVPGSADAQQTPMRDQSAAVAGVGGQLRPLGRGPEQTVIRGPVASIIAPTPTSYGRVMIDGAAGAVHGFEYVLPARVPLPLRVGETVELTITQVYGGPNVFITIIVRDASGQLLAFWSDHTGEEALEGWRVHDRTRVPGLRRLPIVRSVGTVREPIAVEHMGHVAFVAPGRWRRLQASDATWLITGERSGPTHAVRDFPKTSSCLIVRAP